MNKIQIDVYVRAHGDVQSIAEAEKIDVNNSSASKVRVYFYWKHGRVVPCSAIDQEILAKLYKSIGGNSGPLLNNTRSVINEEIEILNKINRFSPGFRG